MNEQRAAVLFLDGCVEEVRLLSIPHRHGYVYSTRDGRVVARGTSAEEAYEQLARLTGQRSAQVQPAPQVRPQKYAASA